MFKKIGDALGGVGQQPQAHDDRAIKRVFMVLHGFYGSLFLNKFSTGQVGEDGEDQGMASARRVWDHTLREYDLDTIKLALGRCRERHPEYPPSLPQFTQLCEAAKPRAVWTPPPEQVLLEMSPELREQRRAEHRRRAMDAAHCIVEPPEMSGLDLLKQAIAKASAEAGGDEASTLLHMDRVLAPRRPLTVVRGGRA